MEGKLKSLLVAESIIGLISGFMIVALPLYLTDIGLDLSKIGIVFGLSMILYAFLCFYLGSYSEYSGRLWVGILAIVGMILSSILFGTLAFLSLTITLLVFVISRILLNISSEVFDNIIKIRVLDISQGQKLGANYGLLILVFSLGCGGGMLLGGFILSLFSFQTIFFGIPVVLLIALFFYKRSGDIAVKLKKEKIFKVSHILKTSKLFKAVLLLYVFSIFGTYLVDFFGLPLFQKEVLGMSNAQVFILIGVAWLVYAPFSYLGGKIYDKYGTKGYMVGLFFISITSIMLAFAKTIFLFSVVLIIDYIFFGLTDPAGHALKGFVSMKKKGMLMSFFKSFGMLSAAILLLFFGKLVSLFRFEFMFVIRSLAHVAGIFCLIYINKLTRSKPKQPLDYGKTI